MIVLRTRSRSRRSTRELTGLSIPSSRWRTRRSLHKTCWSCRGSGVLGRVPSPGPSERSHPSSCYSFESQTPVGWVHEVWSPVQMAWNKLERNMPGAGNIDVLPFDSGDLIDGSRRLAVKFPSYVSFSGERSCLLRLAVLDVDAGTCGPVVRCGIGMVEFLLVAHASYSDLQAIRCLSHSKPCFFTTCVMNAPSMGKVVV